MEQQVKEFESLLDKLEEWNAQGLAPAEISLRMRRFMEYKARMKAVPMRGSFELTPLCNLNCKMCYIHLNREQFDQQGSCLLTGKQWCSIIKQAIDMGMLEATLTGGEALLHPDFDEILLFLEKHYINVNLKSNGLLLTQERIAFLKAHHLSSIQISVYGSDEESYERVTGIRAFEMVIEAITRVREAGIPLEVVITPNKYVWPDLERLIRLIDSMGVQYSVNPGLIEPLEETGRAGIDHDLTLEQYVQMNKFVAALKGATLVQPCVGDIPAPGGQKREKVEGMQCAAGRCVFSVTWRGMVHPCRMLENIGFDGKQMLFAEGWHSINEAVKRVQYPQECIGCAYERVCPSCVVQHGYGAKPGHANPAICQRAARMAAEGFFKMSTEG